MRQKIAENVDAGDIILVVALVFVAIGVGLAPAGFLLLLITPIGVAVRDLIRAPRRR